jgi:hypothetical protein
MTRPPTTTDREAERLPAAVREDRGHQHQDEDGEEVLDDQPPDRDVAGRRVQLAVVGQDADQHDRAGHRQREAEDDPGGEAPAGEVRDPGADRRRDQALHDRAGNRDRADGEQILDVQLQPDAEHQQDDADLGELLRDGPIGDEARRVGPDDQTGRQVADDRRQAQPLRDVPADQGGDETARQRENQLERVHAVVSYSRDGGRLAVRIEAATCSSS